MKNIRQPKSFSEILERDGSALLMLTIRPQPVFQNNETGNFEMMDDGTFQLNVAGYHDMIYDYPINPPVLIGETIQVNGELVYLENTEVLRIQEAPIEKAGRTREMWDRYHRSPYSWEDNPFVFIAKTIKK